MVDVNSPAGSSPSIHNPMMTGAAARQLHQLCLEGICAIRKSLSPDPSCQKPN